MNQYTSTASLNTIHEKYSLDSQNLHCKHQHKVVAGNKCQNSQKETNLTEEQAPSLFMLQESFNKDENKTTSCVDLIQNDFTDSDIENLIELSYKPIDVILGGCLKLNKVTSKIILNPKPEDPVPPKPKNLIIEWEKMKCVVKERITDLGVEKCDPNEYIEKFGPNLIQPEKMPEIANKAAVEAVEKHGKQLAAQNNTKYFNELEGDLHALTLIDLDKEGLGEYKYLLDRLKY